MGIMASSSSPNEEDHHHRIQPSNLAKNEFHNKSILITGASCGLGRSLALAVSSCNPSLIILSGRDEAALKRVQEDCIPHEQIIHVCDILHTPGSNFTIHCASGTRGMVFVVSHPSLTM